jgi:hypothetical protein
MYLHTICPFKYKDMVISIVIGLIIWLAVPLFFKTKLKKHQYKAVSMVCKIIGIAIIVWTVINQIKVFMS